MDPDLKHLLTELLALEKENHRLAKAIHRHQLISSFWRIILWLFVIATTAYSYYFYLQPLMQKFSVSGSPSVGSYFTGLPSSADLQKLIDSYKAAQ